MSSSIAQDSRTSPVMRISYPQVFTPKAFQAGQTPRYGVVILIDKKDKEQMAFMRLLHADAAAVLAVKWPNPETRPRIPLTGHDKSVFKDGDTALNNQGIPVKERNPEYTGHYFVRAGSTQKPIVVDRNRNEIRDPNEIYGGCYCKVNVNAYTFDQALNKGVTLGLNGIQKIRDGEAFGGGKPPLDEMFEAEAGGAEDAANYADPFAGDDTPF